MTDNALASNKYKRINTVRLSFVLIPLALFFIGGIFNSQFFLAAFIFSCIVCINLTNNEIFCVLFFQLPFTMVFKINPDKTSLFTYFSLIVAVLMLIRIKKIPKKVFILIALMAIYLLPGVKNDYTMYIKLIVNFFLLYFFIIFSDEEHFSRYIFALAMGLCLSSVLGLYKQDLPSLSRFFTDFNEEYISGVKTVRFSGLHLDPNYYSIIVMTVIFSLLSILIKYKKHKKLNITLIFTLILFGLLTYSKIAVAGLAIIILFIFNLLIKRKKVFSSLIFLIILVTALVTLYYKTDIIDNFIYRFSAEDISNNRFDIWDRYLGFITASVKNLFIGVGIGAGYYGSGPHNFYIELVYFLGIIGTFIYALTFVTILKVKSLLKKRSLLNNALFIIIGTMSTTLGMFRNNDFIYLMMFCWMFLNFDFLKDKNIIMEKNVNVKSS